MIPPKRKAQLTHKICAISAILIETLDEIKANSEISQEFRTKCEEIIPICEIILDESFKAEQVRSSTYLTDLSNKIDTVIRRNYQKITE